MTEWWSRFSNPRPQGDYVWLDSATGVQIGAQVKQSEKGKLQLVDDEGKVKLSVVTTMRIIKP